MCNVAGKVASPRKPKSRGKPATGSVASFSQLGARDTWDHLA